jgi:MFS family permease
VGRVISRTGRYKVFPAVGLAVMAVGLLLLSTMGASTSRVATAVFMVVFGIGFGMVSQVLVLAIQNAVDGRDIGIATASANLFRGLGGAIGAAALGAVFAGHVSAGGGVVARVDGVDAVFLVAAPIAAVGALIVLFLREVPLRQAGRQQKPQQDTGGNGKTAAAAA